MSNYKAKPIVENKFWILESDEGSRVGTVAVKDNRVKVIINDKPLEFNTLDEFIGKYDVSFAKRTKEFKQEKANEIYGYTTNTEPFNALWNVEMKVPVYTKNNKSNSYHCAGYYIIQFESGWVKSFCPKLITLQRYPYKGPFKTKLEMLEQMRIHNETI